MGRCLGQSGDIIIMSKSYIEYCQNCICNFRVNDETQREYEVELLYCPFCGIELDTQETIVEWEDEEYDEVGC